MEYEAIIGLSRKQVRDIAKLTRKAFGIETLLFPVVKVLDLIEVEFPDNIYHVVEDDSLFEYNTMAYLEEEQNDCYCIHIRKTIYEGACKGWRNCLGFINHEISHFILVGVLGIKPKRNNAGEPIVYARKIAPLCKSMEWQAMALCGELMIPYEECKNMTEKQIIAQTKSTDSQTRYFLEKVVPNVGE